MTDPNWMSPAPQSPTPVLPYQTPGVSSAGVVCPTCRGPQFKPVKFTWWGGVLGPKLFNHVKCLNCGTGFNSKTGKSNNKAIAIYVAVGCAIGLAIFLVYALA